MLAPWTAALVAATLGVDVGWQPVEDGSLEYIIQIDPEMAARLKEGDIVIEAGVRPSHRNVSRYRIVVGRQPLPKDSGTPATPNPATERPQLDESSTIPPATDDPRAAEPPIAAEPPPVADTSPGRSSGLLNDDSRPAAPPLIDPPKANTAEDPFSPPTPTETEHEVQATDDASAPPAKSDGYQPPSPGDYQPPSSDSYQPPATDGYKPPVPGEYKPPGVSVIPKTDTDVASPADSIADTADDPTEATADTNASEERPPFPALPPRVAETDTVDIAPPERLRIKDPNVAHANGHAPEKDTEENAVPEPEETTTGPVAEQQDEDDPSSEEEADNATIAVTPPSTDGGDAVTAESKPWGLLVGTGFLLFLSIGANAFLFWIAWEARARLRAMLDRAKLTQPAVGT